MAPEIETEAPAEQDPHVRISLGGAWPKMLIAGFLGLALGGGSGLPMGLTLAESKAGGITEDALEDAVEDAVEDHIASAGHPITEDELKAIQRELARMNAILALLARDHGLELPQPY